MSSCFINADMFKPKEISKTAIVLAGGEAVCYRLIQSLILRDGASVFAVDRGFDLAESLGIRPVLTIGDFDSTDFDQEQIAYLSDEVKTLEVDKDETDLEAGMDEVLDRGYKNIHVFGALEGKRNDFFLSNILLLFKYREKGLNISIYSKDGTNVLVPLIAKDSFLVNKEIDKGKPFSVISLAEDTEVSIEGMKYNYKGLLPMTSTRGISNRAIEGGKIEVLKGKIIVSYYQK